MRQFSILILLLSFGVSCLSQQNPNPVQSDLDEVLLDYTLHPQSVYYINELSWTELESGEFTYIYDYKIKTKNLDKIKITVIDTSFQVKYYLATNGNPIRGNLIPKGEYKSKSRIAYSKDSKVIISDNNKRNRKANSYSQGAIHSWNNQKLFPSRTMKIGERYQNRENSKDYRTYTNHTYELDSIVGAIAYLTSEEENYKSSSRWIVSSRITHLEYNVVKNYFRSIKCFEYIPTRNRHLSYTETNISLVMKSNKTDGELLEIKK